MKILIVTDAWAPQVNGVVRTLQNTHIQLTRLGHEVAFITPDLFKTVACPTYPEIRLAWMPGKKVSEMIEAFKPDCLHIATEGPLGWAARRVALKTKRPFTTAYHTRFPEYVKARFGIPLALSYAVFRWFHRPSSGVMVATPSIQQELAAQGFKSIKTWSRGVDLTRFNNPSLTLQTANNTENKTPVFLYAGRVAIEKNIEAFLALDLPGEQWVAGDGPQRAALQSKYPKAKWLGMLNQTELAAAYSKADVFVFPSLTDTFGLVMLEAMACGLPVAAFPVAGPRDVILDPRVGALDTNLRNACLNALQLKKKDAWQYAQGYSWANCTGQFVSNLQPIYGSRTAPRAALPSNKPSTQLS